MRSHTDSTVEKAVRFRNGVRYRLACALLALCSFACEGDPDGGDETCHEEVAAFDWLFRPWATVPINDIWVDVSDTGTTRVRAARADGSVAGENRPGRFAEVPVSEGALVAIEGNEAGRLWALAENGAMYETTVDASGVWQTGPAIPTSATLKSMTRSEADELWAVGTDGLVAHFDGEAWSIETHGTGVLEGVWAQGDEIWVVGEAGAARRNGDGIFDDLGPGTTRLHGVFGLPSGELWVAGDGGGLFAWNGTSWDEIATPTQSSLRAIWADPVEGLWAGGDEVLLHSSHGSSSAVDAIPPSDAKGFHVTTLHGARDPTIDALEIWAGTAEGMTISGGEGTSIVCE